MSRRNRGWSAVLILSVVLMAAPAGAAQQRRAQPARDGWTWLPQLWHAVVERVVPLAWKDQLGPGMDPNGLPSKPDPQGGPTTSWPAPGSCPLALALLCYPI